jgi:hypothetical protein
MNDLTYMKKLFGQTRKLDTEWFEADNLDKIRLIIENDEVVVENEHGTTYDVSELSEIEIGIITDNLESTEQYVFDELFYVKEKQFYDDGSSNGLVELRFYFVEDFSLSIFTNIEIDQDVVVDDLIYEIMEENGFYINNVKLTQI